MLHTVRRPWPPACTDVAMSDNEKHLTHVYGHNLVPQKDEADKLAKARAQMPAI